MYNSFRNTKLLVGSMPHKPKQT